MAVSWYDIAIVSNAACQNKDFWKIVTITTAMNGYKS